jgi:BirA family biotin operon repressor/biotin-[acetyl-CoA-carboxylase] ligase
MEFLHDKAILQALSAETQPYISGLEVFSQIESTNSHLMHEASKGAPSGRVCLAELQTAGKGRRGRSWVSPFALNLYLSLLWRIENCSAAVTGLSLLIGVGLAQILESLGVKPMSLKWPNDLLYLEKKLGGILLEMAGEMDGRCYVVVGVGVNFDMPHQYGKFIEQPWTDLTHVLAGPVPSRNRVAARVIESIVETIRGFERSGLAGLPAKWHRYDCTAGKPVELHTPLGTRCGYGAGVDELGRFILEGDGNRRAYASGEVSLRRRSSEN